MNLRRFLLALPLAVVLAGCADTQSYISSSVSVFHQFRPEVQGPTYSVVPWRQELVNSLEFNAYARQLTAELRARGLNMADPGQPASFMVFLDYGVDQGRTELSRYFVPQWGLPGFVGLPARGPFPPFGNSAFVNTSPWGPTFGMTTYRQEVVATRVFVRFLNMDIVESGTGRQVYQGRLTSDGRCNQIPVVMPYLIRSITLDFPGESGGTRRIELPFNASC